MSIKCLMNGMEVNYPCSPVCVLFGDCVAAFEAHKKEAVLTKADRIRAMSDKELAVFLADEVPHGDCCDCRLGCIWTDEGEFESSCQKAWYEWIMLTAEREGENAEK